MHCTERSTSFPNSNSVCATWQRISFPQYNKHLILHMSSCPWCSWVLFQKPPKQPFYNLFQKSDEVACDNCAKSSYTTFAFYCFWNLIFEETSIFVASYALGRGQKEHSPLFSKLNFLHMSIHFFDMFGDSFYLRLLIPWAMSGQWFKLV